MEQELLKKVVEILKNQKRPEKICCTQYGKYSQQAVELLYNDSKYCYEIQQITSRPKEVHSINAFVDVIKEELRRCNNPDGDKATVQLNLDGGHFCADDDFYNLSVNYKRMQSQQWELFKGGINKRMDHKQFLLFLQALKPSIDNFDEVFRKFVTLRLVGNSQITSNPIITDNGQSEGYTCTYKLDNGTDGDATFPSSFDINLQFAKAGAMNYDISVELFFYRDSDDELVIQVLCPMFEHIEEKAIIDEANYVKANIADAKNLLILSDF